MKTHKWKLLLGLGLVLLSAALYTVHYFIFHDPHHIWLFLVGDIAFVPLEVLLVTLILHELLDWREKRSKLQKLNMAIGVFYAEMGSDLLRKLRGIETSGHTEEVCLSISGTWTDAQFRQAKTRIGGLKQLDFSTSSESLNRMHTYLQGKRSFLLSLLENPNLLEHEAFTDLLWAVFHLVDELNHREELGNLPPTDQQHLVGDMERAFTHLLAEWISYMQHLKKDYPYLFSLAVRTNPFLPESQAVVKE